MARRTLSNEVKQGILDGLKNGVSPVSLAQQFGVSIPTIYNYRKLVGTVEATGNLEVAASAVTSATPAATVATRKSTAKASR
jgi:transposase-like protein